MASLSDRTAVWVRSIYRVLGRNRFGQLGIALTTSSGISMVLLWLYELTRGGTTHPYAGIVIFLVLPGVFVAGLVLIPVGVILERRRAKRLRAEGREAEVSEVKESALRRTLWFVGGATAANIVLFGAAGYFGLEFMDSVSFCGEACHTVMAPELAAYKGSPHSRVACVECHIGAGADWFVKSKLSGTRQLFAVAFKTYSRPIPSPVHALRPARETCEQCHWPQRFAGDKFVVRTRYAEDEKSTPLHTVLLLKLGGRTATGTVGIHGRHLDAGSRITYETVDMKREKVARVTYRDDSGKDVEYASTEIKATPADLGKGEKRAMDCIDCHNRPTHAFELPERGVDRVIRDGSVSRDLPFVKKKAVELLKADYPDQKTAAERIAAGLVAYYEKEHPEVFKEKRALVDEAVKAVQSVYLRNVFPDMKLTWGTHPNHIGHQDFPGCFRCHDGNHQTADGKVIAAECDSCHTVLAMEEESPEVFKQLGLR